MPQLVRDELDEEIERQKKGPYGSVLVTPYPDFVTAKSLVGPEKVVSSYHEYLKAWLEQKHSDLEANSRKIALSEAQGKFLKENNYAEMDFLENLDLEFIVTYDLFLEKSSDSTVVSTSFSSSWTLQLYAVDPTNVQIVEGKIREHLSSIEIAANKVNRYGDRRLASFNDPHQYN